MCKHQGGCVPYTPPEIYTCTPWGENVLSRISC